MRTFAICAIAACSASASSHAPLANRWTPHADDSALDRLAFLRGCWRESDAPPRRLCWARDGGWRGSYRGERLFSDEAYAIAVQDGALVFDLDYTQNRGHESFRWSRIAGEKVVFRTTAALGARSIAFEHVGGDDCDLLIMWIDDAGKAFCRERDSVGAWNPHASRSIWASSR